MRKSALVFILFLLLFCSCKPASDKIPEPASSFTVGVAFPIKDSQYQNILRVVEAADGEMLANDFKSKGLINRVQELIDANVDGIIVMPMDEAVLPQIAEMCEKAGVFWAITMRPLHDQEIKQVVESSPFYAGLVQENDNEIAYEIVKQLAMEGNQKIALIMPMVTDPVGEARARGVYRAAAEFGVEIVVEINNAYSDEDFYNAISNVIVAYPTLDAIFRVGSHNLKCSRSIISAIEASDRCGHIGFASIDLEEIAEEDFEKGIVTVAAGGHGELDSTLAAGILVNAINKTPISQNRPAEVTIEYLMIRSAQDLQKYNQAFAENGEILFSEEAARQMLLRKNNDAITQEDYEHIASLYTLENLDILKTWNPDP